MTAILQARQQVLVQTIYGNSVDEVLNPETYDALCAP
jgi:hypothetical protein